MLEQTTGSGRLEAGCDEAGRGALAGDLYAAAVILPIDFHHPLLNDSKQMSRRSRDILREVIEREALAWHVVSLSPRRIEQINILNASHEAMSLAAAALMPSPELLVIDGNRFSTALDIPFVCEVKGDGRFAHIAAASVLAKTHRDEHMEMLDKICPEYGWAKNMGYPTKAHREAIRRYGVSDYHRQTYNLLGSRDPELF